MQNKQLKETQELPTMSDEPDEGQAADLAMHHHAAHSQEANAAGMTSHQFAMKHKESPGTKGHRARMVLALNALRHAEAEKQLSHMPQEQPQE